MLQAIDCSVEEHELNWQELNWQESNWQELNWHELNWQELNWQELNWQELNWQESNWQELMYTPQSVPSICDFSRTIIPGILCIYLDIITRHPILVHWLMEYTMLIGCLTVYVIIVLDKSWSEFKSTSPISLHQINLFAVEIPSCWPRLRWDLVTRKQKLTESRGEESIPYNVSSTLAVNCDS